MQRDITGYFLGVWLFASTMLLMIMAVDLMAESPQYRIADQYIVLKKTPKTLRSTSAFSLDVSLASDGKNTRSGNTSAIVPYDSDVEAEFCNALKEKDSSVYICEANTPIELQRVPNDPSFDEQYVAQHISLPDAWEETTGSKEVIVAVLDTGIDYRHPDLAANIWTNKREIKGNGEDDDRNGIPDDIHGANIPAQSGECADDNGHGTHVAGIVGSQGNNSKGVAGVAWNVSLMAVKIMNADGVGTTYDAVQGMRYAVNQGAHILNGSFGGSFLSASMQAAIQAAEDAGVIYVAAAGNRGDNNDRLPNYPAAFENDNIISVAASDKDKNLAWFSNYGANTVDIVAPGVKILSTIPDGGYAAYSGTSMAAPVVSGVVALLKAKHPFLSAKALKDRLLLTGDQQKAFRGLVASQAMVNAHHALVNKLGEPPENIDDSTSPAKAPGAASITEFTPHRNQRRKLRAGKQLRFTIEGLPYDMVSMVFELTTNKDTQRCTPWNVPLSSDGMRSFIARVPKHTAAKEITLSLVFSNAEERSLRIKGKRRARRKPKRNLFDSCEELMTRVRIFR